MIESLAEIDWQKVESAVLSNPEELLSFEFEDLKAMLWAATEKWLPTDLKTLGNLRIESEINLSIGDSLPIPGRLDLTAEYIAGPYEGSILITDWKTSEGELDKNWESRLVRSFQWRLYGAAEKAHYFSYRGINTRCKTREVFINMPEFAFQQAERQFRLVSNQIKTLLPEDVWPMKMPSSCGAFNSVCPFVQDCETDTMPRYQLDPTNLHLSYSGMDRFQLCPEKFRRVNRTRDTGNDNTRLGSAFHRGMECIYAQSFGLAGK